MGANPMTPSSSVANAATSTRRVRRMTDGTPREAMADTDLLQITRGF